VGGALEHAATRTANAAAMILRPPPERWFTEPHQWSDGIAPVAMIIGTGDNGVNHPGRNHPGRDHPSR